MINFKTPDHKCLLTPLDDNKDPVSNLIKKYKNCGYLLDINYAFPRHSFVFESITKDYFFKAIRKLKPLIYLRQHKKETLLQKMFKKNAPLFAHFFILLLATALKVEFHLLALKRLI